MERKEILSSLIGMGIVIIYLIILSAAVGESIFSYLGDNLAVLILVVGSGGLIGKFIGDKLVD